MNIVADHIFMENFLVDIQDGAHPKANTSKNETAKNHFNFFAIYCSSFSYPLRDYWNQSEWDAHL